MRLSFTKHQRNLDSRSILIVGNFLSASLGTKSVCEELSSRLNEAGWRVCTTSPQPNRVFRIMDMLFTIWRKRTEYNVAQVDVYSGFAFVWAEWSTILLKAIGKPVVLNLHGGNLPAFSKANKKRVKNLFQMADRIVSPSRYLQMEMQPYCSDIRNVSNAIDLSKYSFRLRKHLAPNLIWLRAFHEIYNPMLIPDILGCLVKEFSQINIRMIGPVKDKSLMKMQLRSCEVNVESRINIVGSVKKSQVPVELNKGDIFLNTTNVDNTPVSILEAMACGLCVVSTNVGGIPYLLDDGTDALLVPPNDPEAMASAIRRILTEPGLAERLSQNARKKAEQYDWSVIMPQWESLFAEVVNRHERMQP